ncbi:MAG: D-glycero-beta-D-manno-heptose 1-phosphate adenylyltransferase [Bacteroidetes bacterium]|nr:D-glycero-beta-D-manno-heptose 1-phosphate adenylyltransferase [Bacteroidota bacterium]
MQKFEVIQSKILKADDLHHMLAYWRFKGMKIVFTNGCFDILHAGHVEYLAKAASEGNVLIIGLNTDASVRRIKGHHRPINDENARALIMASLNFVNAVVLFDEDTPYELIKLIQPDILIKGSDYKPEDIVGYDILKAKGGEIKTIELVPGYSTTAIEQKIFKNLSENC